MPPPSKIRSVAGDCSPHGWRQSYSTLLQHWLLTDCQKLWDSFNEGTLGEDKGREWMDPLYSVCRQNGTNGDGLSVVNEDIDSGSL